MPPIPPLAAAALPAWWPLTPAQTRVALLLARGLSSDRAAREIGCSLWTVRVHIQTIGRILPGDGPPSARIVAFVQAVVAHQQAHPNTAPPARMLRRGAA